MLGCMRDRETIDSELRRIALQRRFIREQGGQPSCRQVDELLDERLGHRPEAPRSTPVRRSGGLRRLAPFAALPLSLVAVATVLVVMLAGHTQYPAAEPSADPPMAPPSSAHPSRAAPKPPALPLDIADKAFIEVLRHDGVPVPSREYVLTHGHAVCDFLAHQPNFADAVGFVQGSSIWDANQSADVAAGAVVSYCPQYEPASPDRTQQPFQDA